MTAGGVVLPITAREKPVAGTVVRSGPGKRKEDAVERTPPRVSAWPHTSCCTSAPSVRRIRCYSSLQCR